jgi:hypothetical protein
MNIVICKEAFLWFIERLSYNDLPGPQNNSYLYDNEALP